MMITRCKICIRYKQTVQRQLRVQLLIIEIICSLTRRILRTADDNIQRRFDESHCVNITIILLVTIINRRWIKWITIIQKTRKCSVLWRCRKIPQSTKIHLKTPTKLRKTDVKKPLKRPCVQNKIKTSKMPRLTKTDSKDCQLIMSKIHQIRQLIAAD